MTTVAAKPAALLSTAYGPEAAALPARQQGAGS
jgi:hypothetical protein